MVFTLKKMYFLFLGSDPLNVPHQYFPVLIAPNDGRRRRRREKKRERERKEIGAQPQNEQTLCVPTTSREQQIFCVLTAFREHRERERVHPNGERLCPKTSGNTESEFLFFVVEGTLIGGEGPIPIVESIDILSVRHIEWFRLFVIGRNRWNSRFEAVATTSSTTMH